MEERRLAALMFTDMVGYSALVQKNETDALALLAEHQTILRSVFPLFHGKEIKTIGDAFLVEFPAALNAAQCAVAIQKKLFGHNASVPGNRRIVIRIGLHVGDVVYKDDDVYGDGVNIAARIEPAASPGGICCSGEVASQIQNKIEFPLVKRGKADLKNIDTEIVLYEVALPWNRASQVGSRRRLLRSAGRYIVGLLLPVIVVVIAFFVWQPFRSSTGFSRERIAVLPLRNLSNDANDEYFADGITEELISSLSKIGSISVIARTSVAKYKNLSKSTLEIGRELMVGTVLEGSVRKAVDKARITVSLIDAASQRPIWSEIYDREISDLLMVQSEIAKNVASELRVQLQAAEQAQLEKQGTKSTEATRLYFLGRFFLNLRTPESVQKALEFFNQAVQIDHSFALPYAGLAECYTLIGAAGYGFLPHRVAVDRAKSSALKALELDSDLAEAHNSLAYVLFRLDWNWKEAEGSFKRAIALKPSYARAHEWYALYLALQRRFSEALPEMRRALELDPLSLSVNTGLGRLLSFDHQYDAAQEQFKQTLSLDSTYAEAHFALGLLYARRGLIDEAIEEAKTAVRLSGERHVILADLGYLYSRAGRKQEARKIFDRLTELSKTQYVSPYNFFILHLGHGDMDRAMEELSKAYEEREGLLVYLNVDDLGSEARSDPRYLEILKKVGFEP